jgi:nicotinamidase/pyrazinamidase
MAKKVLLVIDMLKDFVEPDGALSCGPAAQQIVPFVVERIKQFQSEKNPVIFIQDEHLPDDAEFKRFPVHCVKETPGAELIDELELLRKNYTNSYVLPKNRYSGFFRTNLEKLLEEINPQAIHVVGVCTNICVLYTVEELCNRDYTTYVYKEGVTSFDSEGHRWALQQMESILGAIII